jgi:hypothetical protein
MATVAAFTSGEHENHPWEWSHEAMKPRSRTQAFQRENTGAGTEVGESQVPGQPELHRKALSQNNKQAGSRWFTRVILATQETAIRRIMV